MEVLSPTKEKRKFSGRRAKKKIVFECLLYSTIWERIGDRIKDAELMQMVLTLRGLCAVEIKYEVLNSVKDRGGGSMTNIWHFS